MPVTLRPECWLELESIVLLCAHEGRLFLEGKGIPAFLIIHIRYILAVQFTYKK